MKLLNKIINETGKCNKNWSSALYTKMKIKRGKIRKKNEKKNRK